MRNFLISMLVFVPTLALAQATYTESATPRQYATGLKMPLDWKAKAKFVRVTMPKTALPAKFDWRDQGLTPIRDQGNCGSCWAFSTAATMADLVKISDKEVRDLSEQALVSCNASGYSCDGGWFAFEEFQAPKGTVYEADFPYTATTGTCKQGLAYHEQVVEWNYIKSDSEVPTVDEMKAAIYKYGPISVAVNATTSMMMYMGGVFNKCTTTGDVNHAVNIVGWDDSTQSWVMRNSWGESWGEKGYGRIKYNCNQLGYAATFAVYKPITPACSPAAVADAGADRTVKAKQSFTVGAKAITGTTYEWIRDGKVVSKKAQFKTSVSKPGVYVLTIKATTSCGSTTDEITITVK